MSIENGYAICFNKWIFDKEIKSELGLLLLISSLCAEKGYCWANNQYFADLFQIDEVSVSRKIKKLEELKHIEINYEKRGAEIVKREIRLTKMLTDDIQKNQSTINKNVKDNNTTANNIINNNKNIKKETVLSEKEILFEEFYKLYQSYVEQKEIEITDKTRATEHYLEKKKKFIQNSKHYTAEEIINGTKDYLAYVDFERKSWVYPCKTMIAFINKKRWVGNDDGTPWIDVLENKRNLQKNVFINKITAPNAYEIKKQIKQQERFLLLDDDMPS
jgi:hypothetical protein